ncbi:MAG TPA: UMP kinase, partial [Candidatus Moranbacteria bacterium]|nr:UMP kinase [Candidatus Moranbacteria bacterium]
MNKNKPTVISLGGSIVVPSGGIAVDFIAAFRDLVLERIKAGQRFVLVVGGGATAREYIRAAEKIDETVSAEDKDWLGIHGTRINAQLLRTVFRAVAHPRVNDNPHRYE